MNVFTLSRLIAICALLVLVTGSVHAAESVPALPHIFFGQVEIGGQPAPVGTIIEAKCSGILTGTNYNPITVTDVGKYGVPGATGTKLLVQGDIPTGTPIEFYVGNVRAQCYDVATASGWKDTFAFKSGEVTQLNLQTGNGTVTTTATTTATATATATQTSSSSSTGGSSGGGGGGGGGSSTVGSSSSGESSTAGTSTTAAASTQQVTSSATQGSQGAGITATQTQPAVSGTGISSQEITTIGTLPTTTGTSQQFPVSWIIGIVVVIIIIGAGAYYYYSRQKPDEKKE